MGPQAKAPGRGRKPRTSASRRSRASPLSPPEGHNRRHRDQVQQHREPGQTGGGRIPASSLPPLRGSGATEVHEQLCKLVGSSLTHLAAFSMKKDDLLRPPQVKQLAQLTYGGGPPCPRRLAHLQLHPPATIGPQTLLSPGLPCIIPRTIAT